MIVALTMLGVLMTPSTVEPAEIVIKSTQMNIVENDVINTYYINGKIQTVRLTPSGKDAQIQSFKETQERLKREEEARIKAEQEERERLKREEESWLDGVFTAYYPENSEMEGGNITATGWNLNESIYYQGYRVIAADKSIPMYSIIEIKINGEIISAIVMDRGGRIKGNLFDVTFSDRESSVNFGRKYGKYRIVRYGK